MNKVLEILRSESQNAVQNQKGAKAMWTNQYKTILSIIIFTAAMALPAVGFAEENKTSQEVPSQEHSVVLNWRDGRIFQAIEFFFDRVSMQCRVDHYDFEEQPLEMEENQFVDMSGWESLKTKSIPHSVDIYGAEERYQICVSEIGDFGEASPPRCVISILPYKPAVEIYYWILFSPEQLNLRKMLAGLPDKPSPDEKTGAYVYNKGLYVESFAKGLYVESFAGRIPGDIILAPDHVLTKTWYEPKYLLPIRELRFGVRRDNSRYMDSIFLAEYDFVVDEGLFDPEHTPCAESGMPIRNQDLRDWHWPEE